MSSLYLSNNGISKVTLGSGIQVKVLLNTVVSIDVILMGMVIISTVAVLVSVVASGSVSTLILVGAVSMSGTKQAKLKESHDAEKVIVLCFIAF